MMKLSSKQLQSFNQNGYIVLRDFASSLLCDTILDKAKEHLSKKIEPLENEVEYQDKTKEYRIDNSNYNSTQEENQTVRRLRQVYSRDKVFKDWMQDSKIRGVLEQILDDRVVITTAHHNSIMTKMPNTSTQTHWHRDRRYWSYENNNLVSVWLALGDEFTKNGLLEFIPGSHLLSFKDGQFDNKEYFIENSQENKKLIDTKKSTPLHKGDVVIFHSLLLHRADKNMTDKPKISFVYTVKGAKNRVIEGSRSSKYPEIILNKS